MKTQLLQANSLPLFRKFSFRYFHLFALLISFTVIFSSCKKEEIIGVMPDTALPSVIGTDPANGETDVQIDKSLAVTFDQQLDTSRFLINITLQKDIISVPGIMSMNGHQVFFTPSTTLDTESEYTILIDITDNISGARTSERHYASVFYTMP